MRISFYPKLAFDGMRKNKKVYIPYILTCMGMIMMFYIISAMSNSDIVKNLEGGGFLVSILDLGKGVIAIFSVIFLFYTHSFLIRLRNKEFGLYNVLGMGKLNLLMLMFWEMLIIAAVSLISGGILGIAAYKIVELMLVKLVHAKVSYSIFVSLKAIKYTISMFLVIFLVIFLYSALKIQISNPIELLKSQSSGEKEPKSNYIIAILGFGSLAYGYYLALTVKNPIQMINTFFIAVIAVIIATYFIMIAGSVVFCKILQKNKKYYYNPSHFVSVSSMKYRMKRNGAGLASICILITMVLVMISSSGCPYVGAERSINERYPNSINITAFVPSDKLNYLNEENLNNYRKQISDICDKYNFNMTNRIDYKKYSSFGTLEGNKIDRSDTSNDSFNNLVQIEMLSLDDYNRITGKSEKLSDDEAFIYDFRINYEKSDIKIDDKRYKINKKLDYMWSDGEAAMSIIPTIYLVVNNFEKDVKLIAAESEVIDWCYAFDTDLSEVKENKLVSDIGKNQKNILNADNMSLIVEQKSAEKNSFYALYGGILFIGLILSIIFIAATVLIIYYKQICEGYEDQSRFNVMQKIGMTKKEIRKSINSQILTVFFIPLVLAGIHLAFAFPMINRMIQLFNLFDKTLYIKITVICYIVFAIIYTIIYKTTSNAYYRIVSGMKVKEG